MKVERALEAALKLYPLVARTNKNLKEIGEISDEPQPEVDLLVDRRTGEIRIQVGGDSGEGYDPDNEASMRNLEAVLNKAADLSDKLANTVRALDKTAKAADLIGFVLPSGQAMKAVRMTLAGGSGKVRALWAGVTSFFGGGAAKTGQTVLGKYPDYITLADELGARRFNIPTDIWNKMSKAEQWAANQKFLDRLIARGDEIVLSNPIKNLSGVTGSFRQELNYLFSKGFTLNKEGTRLIK
jgi:hypothetical protein